MRLGPGLGLTFVALLLGGCIDTASAGHSEVIVNINHSRFEPEAFEFEQGDVVTFVVRNADPIDHEFILGDEAVQDLHEKGAHPSHGDLPGEVSVAADSTATTTYEFTEPGKLIIGCHLPAHYDYGVKAQVTIDP